MTAKRKGSGRHRREWFWRFRPKGADAYVEQTEDGRWHVFVGRTEIAVVATREIAIAVVDNPKK
jgi:hypothetical protein